MNTVNYNQLYEYGACEQWLDVWESKYGRGDTPINWKQLILDGFAPQLYWLFNKTVDEAHRPDYNGLTLDRYGVTGIEILSDNVTAFDASFSNIPYLYIHNSALNDCAFKMTALHSCNIEGATLNDCELSSAVMTESAVYSTVFANCNMVSMSAHAVLFNAVTFNQSQLEVSDFGSCTFEHVQFINCNLYYTVFKNCVFNNVTIVMTNTTFQPVIEKCTLNNVRIRSLVDTVPLDAKFVNSTLINVSVNNRSIV